MYKHSRTEGQRHYEFVALDQICLQVSFIVSYYIRFKTYNLPYYDGEYFSLAVILALILLALALLLNSYNSILKRSLNSEIISVGLLSITTLAATSMYLFAGHTALVYSRLIVYYTIAIFALTDTLFRSLLKRIIIKYGLFSGNKSKSLLVITKTTTI